MIKTVADMVAEVDEHKLLLGEPELTNDSDAPLESDTDNTALGV